MPMIESLGERKRKWVRGGGVASAGRLQHRKMGHILCKKLKLTQLLTLMSEEIKKTYFFRNNACFVIKYGVILNWIGFVFIFAYHQVFRGVGQEITKSVVFFVTICIYGNLRFFVA